MAIIGIDIGGTKILGAVFNKHGEIIDKEKKSSRGEQGFDVFINQVYKVVDQLLTRTSKKIEGIGIGVPGTVNTKGKILFSPNLPIQDFNMAKDLQAKYDVPVRVGNDVNLGTFGEYSELGITHANVIGLFPGTGLGGGIVLDGELYIGKGFAGELGHIVVQKDGVLCGCGNKGCLESYASKKGIISYIKSQLDKGRDCILKDEVGTGVLKSSKLKKAYLAKDKVTLEAIEQFVEYLAMGIGNIMNIFNPDLILIGGGIIDSFGQPLLDEIISHTKTYAMKGLFEQTKVQKSQLSDDAVIYGGYHLIKSTL